MNSIANRQPLDVLISEIHNSWVSIFVISLEVDAIAVDKPDDMIDDMGWESG